MALSPAGFPEMANSAGDLLSRSCRDEFQIEQEATQTSMIECDVLGEPRQRFLLAGIAAGLAVLHLVLWSQWPFDLFVFSGLCWLCVGSLLLERRGTIHIKSGVIASLFGALLVALVLLKVAFAPPQGFERLGPLLSGFGLALVASGFRGLRQYSRELLILAVLGVPTVLTALAADLVGFHLGPLGARAGTFFLQIAGFDATCDGIRVILPTGAVEVSRACSGLSAMIYLLGVSILFLTMFPPRAWFWNPLVPLLAVALAFFVNALRIAFLALLAAGQRWDLFAYWHEENGSMFFVVLSVVIFGCLYRYLLPVSAPRSCAAIIP